MTNAPTISVEVWSDIVCPWCFIGKRRFGKALDVLAADESFPFDVDVVYRPFQLDPRAPRGQPVPVADVYARKFGGPQRAAELIAHVTDIAAAEGIAFHLDKAVRANTADAHRLLWWTLWTAGPAAQAALKESLMTAYFCDGEDVGDAAVLVERATGCGLDEGDVAEMLADEIGLEALAVARQRTADLEITGVPAYVIEGRWVVPGAQEPDVFVGALRRLAAKRVAT